MVQPAHILVVEDSMLLAMSLEETLVDAGYTVTVAETNAAARDAAGRHDFRAALVDYHLTDGNSEALCQQLRETGVPVALVTGIDRDTIPGSVYDHIFFKPVEEAALLTWLGGVSN